MERMLRTLYHKDDFPNLPCFCDYLRPRVGRRRQEFGPVPSERARHQVAYPELLAMFNNLPKVNR
eukprot:6502492-Pyramimonas_sp.AAC.1